MAVVAKTPRKQHRDTHPGYDQRYYLENKKHIKLLRRRYALPYARQWRWRIRLEMIAAYGGKCACCGEHEPRFLTLEHKYGGGRKERQCLGKGAASAFPILLKLRNKGWPTKAYTVLCYNCNCAKGNYGHCPHKKR